MPIENDTNDESRREPGADPAETNLESGSFEGADSDRYLRLLAEFNNYRRRAAREQDQAFENGVADLARPLLNVLDNLERAAAHADDVPEAWLSGVILTIREFKEALKKAGVEIVDPLGTSFDPRFHEALASLPSGDAPPESIVEVVSPGYRLGDRVLRPARVIVAAEPARNS